MQANEIPTLPLRDIKLPPEPGFWPLAPGWWIVIVLTLLLLTWLAIKYYRYLQKKRRWQQIDRQLSDIEYQYTKSKDKQYLLTELSVFLRRFVRFQLNQRQITTAFGKNWTSHLNELQGNQAFAPFEQALAVGTFQKHCDYDADQLLQTTRNFIKQQVMKPPIAANKAEKEVQHV